MEQPREKTLDIFVRFVFSSDKFVENDETETVRQAVIPSEGLDGWTKCTTLSLVAHSIRKCRPGPPLLARTRLAKGPRSWCPQPNSSINKAT
jgi:hypothetical protein